jgi:hypothetical protein
LIHAHDPHIAGRRAKKAKTILASLAPSPNNQEVRRLTDAGAVPDWFPEIQDVWRAAMNHVSHLDLASQNSPHRFALPPIHLFWGDEPQNQCIYFYHYLLLFNEIKKRPECDLPALTTQEWRSVLGNTVWKKQWPQPDGNPPPTFDPNIFWKYGCSLLFGDDHSAAVAAGHYNPTSQLSCRCNVQLDTADDTNICQVIVYYLNSFHMYEEIKEMERLQFPTTFKNGWAGQRFEIDQIVEMWDLSGGGCQPRLFFQQEGVEKLRSGSM